MCAQMAQLVSPTEQAQSNEHNITEALLGNLYGYVRITDMSQEPDIHLDALRQAKVENEHIFVEQTPSADMAEYANLLRTLRKGDVLVIPNLDVLGNGYDEIIAQWQLLTRIKMVNIVVLDIPLLNTAVYQGTVPSNFIADLALQFMAYASMREREGIRQRQRQGILAAKERGVRFGRPPKPIPPQFETLLAQWKNREISSRKAAQQLGVAQETFLRWSRRQMHP